MRILLSCFILLSLTGCLVPDWGGWWVSRADGGPKFTSNSGSHRYDKSTSNSLELETDPVWTVGIYAGYDLSSYKKRVGHWWWGTKPEPKPEPPPVHLERPDWLDELLKRRAQQGLQEALPGPRPPTGVVVNVTTPVDHHEVPVDSEPDPETPTPLPADETEAQGLLKLYLEADWVTQVVVGLVLICFVALLAVVAIFKGPALIAAWRGYWRRRKGEGEDGESGP